jgi:MoaA/NifB/PqqE/SkfB family radical SAM enzyme
MCNYWKQPCYENELTLDEISDIISNPLFSSIEKMVLSGGEPTLRKDLIDIARTVLDLRPRIKDLTLITNGLETELVTEKVNELLHLVSDRKGTKLNVSVSLDGYGEIHEKIRRVPQAFKQVSETLRRLKELRNKTPFYLCSTSVVQPMNISNLPRLIEFAQEIDLPITLSPISVSDFFIDDNDRNAMKLSNDNLNELKKLLNNELRPHLKLSNVPFWKEYFNIISGEKRRLPCYMLYYFIHIKSHGELGMCSTSKDLVYGNAQEETADKIWYSQKAKDLRKRVSTQLCPTCTTQCDSAFSLTHEIFYYGRFWLNNKIRTLTNKTDDIE